MADDCSNRLLIHCDDKKILKKIHEVFYQKEDGEIRYTMNNLVPIPAETLDSAEDRLEIYQTLVEHWGTCSDFLSLEPSWRKNKFILEYSTPFGTNYNWIYELICFIEKM